MAVLVDRSEQRPGMLGAQLCERFSIWGSEGFGTLGEVMAITAILAG